MIKELEITASLTRNLLGLGESAGLVRARSFQIKVNDEKERSTFSDLRNAVITTVLDHLATPTAQNTRGTSNIPLLVPLTPALSQVTAFARKTGGPFNAGAYLQGMILRGSDTPKKAQQLWKDIGHALAIRKWEADGPRDDIWATLIEDTLTETEPFDGIIEPWDGGVSDVDSFLGNPSDPGRNLLDISPCPARAFVKDLPDLINLKSAITRRQWLTVLDSFFRLVLASDLLWISSINQGLQRELQHQLAGGAEVPTTSKIPSTLLSRFEPITIGDTLKDAVEQETLYYVTARLFITVLLEELRRTHPAQIEDITEAGGLNSPEGICHLLQTVHDHGGESLSHHVSTTVNNICSDTPALLQVTESGTPTHNYYSCVQYSLQQRKTLSDADSHFDQGYWAKKRLARDGTDYDAAPFVFTPGPVALITFVHLACSGADGLGTVSDFRRRLGSYGVHFADGELNNGRVGRAIRDLGLVIDSPDAEGGMLLRTPFNVWAD
jgi:hypothetical protein